MNRSCFYWNNSDDVSYIAVMLRRSKIILGASDTILGLLAPLSREGFNILNKIKGRSDKPYIVLIGNPDRINLFGEKSTSTIVQSLINHCWPGPLTLIVKAKKDLPSFLQSSQRTIALRMPDHQGLLSLLQQFDGLFSTSANKANMPVPYSIDKVDPQIIEQAAAVILDSPEQEKVSMIKPSTILDCTRETIQVVREGVYPVDELEVVCNQTFRR